MAGGGDGGSPAESPSESCGRGSCHRASNRAPKHPASTRESGQPTYACKDYCLSPG